MALDSWDGLWGVAGWLVYNAWCGLVVLWVACMVWDSFVWPWQGLGQLLKRSRRTPTTGNTRDPLEASPLYRSLRTHTRPGELWWSVPVRLRRRTSLGLPRDGLAERDEAIEVARLRRVLAEVVGQEQEKPGPGLRSTSSARPE